MPEFQEDTSRLVEERPRRGPHPVNEQAETELSEARKAACIGAQVVLPPDSDASYAARGGMATDIAGNTVARDIALLAMGLDPASPSANMTDPTRQVAAAQMAGGEA